MYKTTKYFPQDLMSDLIIENPLMLNLLSRFAMPLGVGQKTIRQCCEENNVDTDTFLQIVTLTIDPSEENVVNTALHFPSVLRFLENSHKYFAEFRLPFIKANLEKALKEQPLDINKFILAYFDEYLVEVKKHFDYEERKVFPYITALINNTATDKYKISTFSRHHDHIEIKLMELKNIIIKYYNLKTSYELSDVLGSIFITANDLQRHNELENHLLVPTVSEIEHKKR
ncbi:MAG: hemerythrin domain-containing protein [Bacteroidales bacterium]|jgi:regulator of cell morphogenesis and NO signaling|nr:hemerythrin domain-containing protein [Bacteroidales bacterium]